MLKSDGSKRINSDANEHDEMQQFWLEAVQLDVLLRLYEDKTVNILYEDKRVKPQWVDNLPVGSACQLTPKRNMTVHTFVKWINRFSKVKP